MRVRPTLSDSEVENRMTRATRYDRAAVLVTVETELRGYERRHGISTAEMRRRVTNDEMAETDDVCSWLMVHNRWRALQ
jgi:hypothetical protein